MNRKHIPWVIGLLVLLLPACLCPALGGLPSGALATASALAPTLFAALAQTATAAAAVGNHAVATATSRPTATAVVNAAATATSTPTATKTRGPTDTPTPTATPTEQAALAPITDVCALIDAKAVAGLMGEKSLKADKFARGAYQGCFVHNANSSVAFTAGVVQGPPAYRDVVQQYVEIKAAKGCDWTKLPNATPAEIDKGVVELKKLGSTEQQWVRESLSWRAKLITDQGCTDAEGLKELTGLGDEAYAEHIYGYEEVGVVKANTIFWASVYKQGMTPDQALAVLQPTLATIFSGPPFK